jgi:hypothetical protein
MEKSSIKSLQLSLNGVKNSDFSGEAGKDKNESGSK